MKDIVISGYYGFHNNGDDALLKAIINDLETRGLKERVVVLSCNPEETARVYGVRALNRYNYFRIGECMQGASLLIFGGGTLLQDSTSSKSLWYYLSIIALALKYKLKTMVYANGIGPLERSLSRKLTVRFLRRVDYITVRDKASYDYLYQLGITNSIQLTADPVFNLAPSSDVVGSGLLRLAGTREHAKIIGISVREWDSLAPEFFDIIHEVGVYAKEKYNLNPVLIPMQPDKDIKACKLVAKGDERFKILTGDVSVQDMLSVIKQMDLIIGMRLHTLIYAASAGVPLIGIVYDPKVSGFMEYSHQKQYVDATEVTLDGLKKLIDESMTNYHTISSELKDLAYELRKLSIKNGDIAEKLYF